MKVHVYVVGEDDFSVMVEPSVGKGRAPVLLQKLTQENLVANVQPVVEGLRLPKGAQLPTPG